ncbi:interleukin-27 subunit beta-like [Peromyscus leucopus]|uniref:interleukin-27 subunit beta-like n=1 Tax=Peromyscus leucopus TaxID=10041 RepID=UPI00188555AC|nr:interleukin-27 subunit beta-like [Peromyscus leucopus]
MKLGVAAQEQIQSCLQPNSQATRCTIPHVHLFSMVPYVLMSQRQVRSPGRRVPAGQRLQMFWHPAASWPFPGIFSLKYHIRYRRHGASHFRQVGTIEATTFTLRAAQPHAKYFVQVSSQGFMDYGKPSDWSLPGQAERTPQNA